MDLLDRNKILYNIANLDFDKNTQTIDLISKVLRTIKDMPSGYDGCWIPCSERMPEEPYGCLVTIEDEEPMTGQMFETILPYFVGWDGERWNDAEGEQCPFEVIAWMPLPEQYKAESEDV